MPYKEVLFTAVIGSIIGYITNWLAIKMLFRPRTEKRIFGIKVPFTPGLIPKEQKRIANSIGNTVGNHLLTSDTILHALKNNKINEKFKAWVEARTIELENSDKSVKEQVSNIIGDKVDPFINNIKIKAAKLVLIAIRKDKFKEEMEKLVLKEIKNELSLNPQSILDSNYYKDIRINLLKRANEFKSSEDFKRSIQTIIESKISTLESDNKSLKDIIPVELVSSLKVYIYSRNYDIAMSIKNLLKEEKTQAKIKHALGEMISDNLNSMLAMFLNPDTIYSKVLPAIEAYLDKEDTHREIALFINELIDKGLENKFSDVLYNLSEDAKKRNAKSISDTIVDKIIDGELIEGLVKDLEDKLKNNNSLEDALWSLNINVDEFIKNFITDKISHAISSREIENKIETYVSNLIDDVMNMPLSDILRSNDITMSKAAAEIAGDVFDTFIRTRAVEFLEAFDISKIVEDKINAFDVSFTEKLILEISSRELEAITWLGAFLGFIMGLVSAIITRM